METTGKANYKIRVNIPCQLYIDDELRQDLEPNKMVKLSLDPGPYLRKVVAVDNPSLQDEKEIEIPADTTLLDNIKLGEVADSVSAKVVANPPVNAVPVVQEIMKEYDIFISYRKDCSSERVEKLYNYLNAKYPEKVFRDTKQLAIGDWLTQIVQYVDTCKMLVVVLDRDTFKDRDISNDTKELYERWATLSREELHAEIESLPLNEKENVNYIRLEILRARAHNVTIFPIKCGIGKLSEDLENALYLPQSFEVSDVKPDEWMAIVEKEWETRTIAKLFLSRYSKLGKDIQPSDIYYDKERTKSEYGFVEDFYYRRKELDDRLDEFVVDDKDKQFLFITGMPGSGKTRAVYQLCKTGALRDKPVAILNKGNIREIVKYFNQPDHNTTPCYFVCDQIVDVLKTVDEETKIFLDRIANSESKYHLIATNTSTRLDAFLDEEDLIDETKYKKISIPQLNNSDFIAALERKFGKKSGKRGKTVADYIPGLNKYNEKIYTDISKDIDSTFLANWLKALQSVTIFRRESNPFFMTILVLEKLLDNIDKQMLVKCVEQMVKGNFLYLYKPTATGDLLSVSANEIDISLRARVDVDYNGEKILNGRVTNTTYTFELNELVWHYLEEKTNSPLFDFDAADDVYDAIELWYNTFAGNEISSLIRILPRVPNSTPVIQQVVNRFVKEKLETIACSGNMQELPIEIRHVYGLLLGRAQNDEEVNAIVQKLENTPNYLINDNIVGEWYRYAKIHYIHKVDRREYIEREIRPRKSFLKIVENQKWTLDLQEGTHLTPEDLYSIRQEYETLVNARMIEKDFQQLMEYIDACFAAIRINKGKLNGRYLSNSSRLQVNAICTMLALNSLAERGNIEAMYEFFVKYKLIAKNICGSNSVYYHLAKQANGNVDKCIYIIDVFFRNGNIRYMRNPEEWTLKNQDAEIKRSFAIFIAKAIEGCRSFSDSAKLYDIYKQAMGEETEDRFALLTKAIENYAGAREFLLIVDYWEREKEFMDEESKKILLGVIMSKAPTASIALEYLDQMDVNYINSYCLRNILDKLREINRRTPSPEYFVQAREVINDERLKPFRNERPILNLLYQLANDIEQEKEVDSIAGKEAKTNIFFLSIKLNKEYRTLKEAYDLYEDFYDNLEDTTKKRNPDMFSSLASRLMKEEKKLKCNNEPFDEQIRDIRKALELECDKPFSSKDSFYFIGCIRLGRIAIIDEKERFSRTFLHNIHKFDTIDSWYKLVDDVQYYQDNKENIKAYQKRLCEKYIEEYQKRRYPDEMRPDRRMERYLDEFKLAINNYDKDVEKIWTLAQEKDNNKQYEEAKKLYLQIIGRKYVATRLGQCYYFTGDIENAVYWNKEGCGEGCMHAPYNLSMLYINHKNEKLYNQEVAIDNLLIAFERGNLKAEKDIRSLIYNKNYDPRLVVKLCEGVKPLGYEISREELYNLGRAYYNLGDGAKCEECYLKATELGHPQSAHDLQDLYAKGNLIPQDYDKALYYLRISAIINSKRGDDRDKQKYIAEYRKRNKGHQAILALYNDFVDNGCELDKNDLFKLGSAYFHLGDGEKCVENYQLASEKGHTQAAHFLYEMYKNGRLVRVDQHKAWYYLKLSVLNNTNPEDTRDKDTFVAWSLGIIRRPENTSLETIIGTYNGLIEVGYEFTREDYYRLGNVLKGINDARCLDHFKTAAELGHATAAYDLWKMYESGIVAEKSIEQARYWMNRAAELDNPFAMSAVDNHMRVMARFNEGVALYPINKEKGIAIFRKLANDGLADAQHRMGVNYYNIALGTNYDVDKRENFERAYTYFLLAANQGLAISQYQVAVCLEQGRGIERDLVEAKRWFQLAANQGHQNALAKLQNLM